AVVSDNQQSSSHMTAVQMIRAPAPCVPVEPHPPLATQSLKIPLEWKSLCALTHYGEIVYLPVLTGCILPVVAQLVERLTVVLSSGSRRFDSVPPEYYDGHTNCI